MTAVSQTMYSVTLFLALIALKLWSQRRHRISLLVRAGAAKTLSVGV